MKNRKESRILWKIWNLHEEVNRLLWDLWDLYEEEFFKFQREEEWIKFLRWKEDHCTDEHANGDEDKSLLSGKPPTLTVTGG
ncbi:MAG: hypothetical protein Q8P64_19100 [Deltaproteobacteria bacterium]|nr:hypothetical protein [Deltaproteobacteria bacterium]